MHFVNDCQKGTARALRSLPQCFRLSVPGHEADQVGARGAIRPIHLVLDLCSTDARAADYGRLPRPYPAHEWPFTGAARWITSPEGHGPIWPIADRDVKVAAAALAEKTLTDRLDTFHRLCVAIRALNREQESDLLNAKKPTQDQVNACLAAIGGALGELDDMLTAARDGITEWVGDEPQRKAALAAVADAEARLAGLGTSVKALEHRLAVLMRKSSGSNELHARKAELAAVNADLEQYRAQIAALKARRSAPSLSTIGAISC